MSFRTKAVLVFFMLVLSGVLAFNLSKPRILVVHSYHPGFRWTADVESAMKKEFARAGRPLHIEHHFIDVFHQDTPAQLRAAVVAAQRAVGREKPDVLMVIDDPAVQHVGRSFFDDPKLKIVFAGVEDDLGESGLLAAGNVTGIVERQPYEALARAVSDLLPQTAGGARIALLGDQTAQTRVRRDHAREATWGPHRLVAERLVETPDAWRAAVAELSNEADVILSLGIRGLKWGEGDIEVQSKALTAWTEAQAKVPVMSFKRSFVEAGGMLGLGASPYEHGTEAARLARALIDGQPLKALPIRNGADFTISYNPQHLERRSIVLPPIYRAFATATDSVVSGPAAPDPK